jgi:tetratricopeptide (TPR) repeat protein
MKHTTIFWILILGFDVFGQYAERSLIEEIQAAYNQLNYPEAEIKAQAALSNFQRYSPTQLTEIHKILGLIYFSQNKEDDARLQFENALSLSPELKLDPLFVSPKIVEFFEDIKKLRAAKPNDAGVPHPELKYVLVQDPRPAAAMRSMIMPGWGQLYKGEKTKGRVLIGLWSAGVIGTVAAHIARGTAEDKYLAETDPARIDSRYNSFNRYHKLRNNLLIFSGGVWLFSYIDAIVKKQSPTYSSSKSVLIFPDADKLRVNILVRF